MTLKFCACDKQFQIVTPTRCPYPCSSFELVDLTLAITVCRVDKLYSIRYSIKLYYLVSKFVVKHSISSLNKHVQNKQR